MMEIVSIIIRILTSLVAFYCYYSAWRFRQDGDSENAKFCLTAGLLFTIMSGQN